MRLLALDAALGPCSVALLDGETSQADQRHGSRAELTQLSALTQALLGTAALNAVAVTVGPGSFTGLRSAISLAHGVALGRGVPVIGVTVAEALAEQVTLPPGAALWVALDTRRGRIFLARDGSLEVVALDELPPPGCPVMVAGDAADDVAVRLRAMGCEAVAIGPRQVSAVATGRVALRRLAGHLPACVAQPLYVEPPEAQVAAGLRPAPNRLPQAGEGEERCVVVVTPAHAAALAAIHAAAFPPPEAWGASAMAAVMAMPGAFGFLDLRGGLVLARAAAGEAEILTLGVLPSLRRQGLGRTLLERALAAVPPMPWFLEVAAGNAAARALYQAAGFASCGTRRGYYPGGGDAMVLRRDGAVMAP